MPPIKAFHQSQLPDMPCVATISLTASGVSAAKVVATILIPAKYHGNCRPPKKKSLILPEARFDSLMPMKIVSNKKKPTIKKSDIPNAIQMNLEGASYVKLHSRLIEL